ncbi:MAG: glycerol-3-phosphate dehydrogenase [Proteobacteria bacterium]|nr:glycerol-3-phosphate dehydrogenase [Pseudomonadota bacterium]
MLSLYSITRSMSLTQIKTSEPYDVMVIGGGINGVGVAADAAGRGLSVLLCDQGDLAGGTSSASSKLIHGGLRYLEYYDFALVKSALHERAILLKSAPHLIKPLQFIMPIHQSPRSIWLLRAGLFLYDFLGAGALPHSKVIHFTSPHPLKSSIHKGFIYSDCFTDDARLVISNAQRAQQYGATLITRMRCLKAQRTQQFWQVMLEDAITHQRHTVYARSLINAAGPWVEQVINQVIQIPSRNRIRLVKGSHILVPKLYEGEQAYILQHTDGRVIFVIPYLQQYSLIGTTDLNYEGALDNVQIDLSEKEYLCSIVNEYFHHPLTLRQILSSWSGLRPLVDDKNTTLAAINRGYKLELQVDEHNKLPLVHVFGGKLTTYRLVAEKVVNSLAPFFAHIGKAWTAQCTLPGGDIPKKDLPLFTQNLIQEFNWLPPTLCQRYAQNYGTFTYTLLENAKALNDLGKDLGHGLYEKEVIYLIQKEWAKTADDILQRRTKLSYVFSEQQSYQLSDYIVNLNNSRLPI